MLFANIGWMIHYQGQSASDVITGGGSYRDDDKHEAFNFQNLHDMCYGYVQPVNWGHITPSRIDKNIENTADKIEDVLVVWTARRPDSGGTFIVGWYKHATVFRVFQKSSSKERKKYSYNIMAKAEDCLLLSVDDRTIEVPRTQRGQKGGMGQSNVWYADKNIPAIILFRQYVKDYIQSKVKKQGKKERKHFRINVEAKKLVEETAVKIVRGTYEERGFEVISVEKDNLGWDLEARKGKVHLRIEVKGLADEAISVHITQNEYSKMRDRDNANYRLCVVTNVLCKPELSTFIFDGDKWICEEDNEMVLSFNEQIAAIAYVK